MFSYFIQWHNLYWYWTTDQYSSFGEIRMSKMSFFSHHTTTKNIAVSLQSFRGKDEYDLFFKTFWLVNHHRDCSLNIFNPCVCFFQRLWSVFSGSKIGHFNGQCLPNYCPVEFPCSQTFSYLSTKLIFFQSASCYSDVKLWNWSLVSQQLCNNINIII